jgi:hypothetical protein
MARQSISMLISAQDCPSVSTSVLVTYRYGISLRMKRFWSQDANKQESD